MCSPLLSNLATRTNRVRTGRRAVFSPAPRHPAVPSRRAPCRASAAARDTQGPVGRACAPDRRRYLWTVQAARPGVRG
eukprot:scaffold15008_cov58-Phaeocystis_antarctica.AAC.2